MLRKISAGLLVLAIGLVAPIGANAASDPEKELTLQSPDARQATASLSTAVATLAGEQTGRDASLALNELYLNYKNLSTTEKKQADALLARPTDRRAGREHGYTVTEARPICGAHVCVHYVKTTGDAPSSTDKDTDGRYDWAEYSLSVMESVWRKEVGQLKYRAPAPDGRKGGNSKFDVYLSDVGNQGLYGKCLPEAEVPGHRFRASAYCVLDEDMVEFEPQPRRDSMKVTAAHEFFHAVQFNYDVAEDIWLLESTATWMEERYADSVNDNRQYLEASHMKNPSVPLDRFIPGTSPDYTGVQYGNWIFFEAISAKYGTGAIRQIWNKLDSTVPRQDRYSIQGIKAFLATKNMKFPRFYAAFGAVNIIPQKVYPEGSAYSEVKAKIAKTYKLTRSRPGANGRATLAHLTNRNYSFVPTTGFSGKRKLRIIVNAPNKNAGSAAWVLIHLRNGKVVSKEVKLNSTGWGKLMASYTRSNVARVTLTLANANASYKCWQSTTYSCQGRPLGNGKVFKFNVRNVRG